MPNVLINDARTGYTVGSTQLVTDATANAWIGNRWALLADTVAPDPLSAQEQQSAPATNLSAAEVAATRALVSGAGNSGTILAPSGAYALQDAVSSPLQIGAGPALWVTAKRGPVKADGTACTAEGDVPAQWLDNSGNGRHLTVLSEACAYTPTGGRNGLPGVRGRMISPAFVSSAYGSAMTLVVVSKEPSPRISSGSKYKLNITTANFWLGYGGGSQNRDVTTQGLTPGTAGGATYDQGGIDAITIDGTTQWVCSALAGIDASTSASTWTRTISGSVPFTNGQVCVGGLSFSTSADNWDSSSEMILFPFALNAAQWRQVLSYVQAEWETVPLIEFVGNSLISGESAADTGLQDGLAPTGSSMPSRMMGRLGSTAQVRTDAYPGRTDAQIYSESPSYSALRDYSGRRIVTVYWEGSNSLIATGSPGATYELIRRGCLQKRAPNKRVIVLGLLYRNDTGNNARNRAYTDQVNALLAANYTSFADEYVPMLADARLADPSNATYFKTDLIHPNNVGRGIVTDLVEPAVRRQMA